MRVVSRWSRHIDYRPALENLPWRKPWKANWLSMGKAYLPLLTGWSVYWLVFDFACALPGFVALSAIAGLRSYPVIWELSAMTSALGA